MAGGRVAVVGSLNVDHVVTVDSLPATGATVEASSYATGPGGKGLNQAVAAARMGAAVTMVGTVGDDTGGRLLLALLDSEGIDRRRVAVVAGPLTCTRPGAAASLSSAGEVTRAGAGATFPRP